MTAITYIDTASKLEWEIDCLDKPLSWDHAMEYEEKSDNGWRLPTVKELISIVDYDVFHPAINQTRFPGTKPMRYWSCDTYAINNVYAWYVTFFDGSLDFEYKYKKAYLRLVRDLNP